MPPRALRVRVPNPFSASLQRRCALLAARLMAMVPTGRLERISRVGQEAAHSKTKKEISSEIEKINFVRIVSNVVLGCLRGMPPASARS